MAASKRASKVSGVVIVVMIVIRMIMMIMLLTCNKSLAEYNLLQEDSS